MENFEPEADIKIVETCNSIKIYIDLIVFGWLSFTSLLITQWDNMHCSYCISVSR
jgi:hypothetical protein